MGPYTVPSTPNPAKKNIWYSYFLHEGCCLKWPFWFSIWLFFWFVVHFCISFLSVSRAFFEFPSAGCPENQQSPDRNAGEECSLSIIALGFSQLRSPRVARSVSLHDAVPDQHTSDLHKHHVEIWCILDHIDETHKSKQTNRLTNSEIVNNKKTCIHTLCKIWFPNKFALHQNVSKSEHSATWCPSWAPRIHSASLLIGQNTYIYIYTQICIHTYIHNITLHYITLRYVTLRHITLHYITLHYIAYIHAYIYIYIYIHI